MTDIANRSVDGPVSLDEVSATLDGSVLARAVRGLSSTLDRAASESRSARMLAAVRTLLGDADQGLLAAGVVLTVAMTVHMLLLVLQPYPFPGASTFWLPSALFAAGVLTIAFRRPIAAAWRDRAGRGR